MLNASFSTLILYVYFLWSPLLSCTPICLDGYSTPAYRRHRVWPQEEGRESNRGRTGSWVKGNEESKAVKSTKRWMSRIANWFLIDLPSTCFYSTIRPCLCKDLLCCSFSSPVWGLIKQTFRCLHLLMFICTLILHSIVTCWGCYLYIFSKMLCSLLD